MDLALAIAIGSSAILGYSDGIHLKNDFIGLILVASGGAIPEFYVALLVSDMHRMDLALAIAVGSSAILGFSDGMQLYKDFVGLIFVASGGNIPEFYVTLLVAEKQRLDRSAELASVLTELFAPLHSAAFVLPDGSRLCGSPFVPACYVRLRTSRVSSDVLMSCLS